MENIETWLQRRIASHLGLDIEAIDVHAPFERLGIDSVEVLAITGDLEDLLGRRLPTTLVWDHPTIARVSRFLTASAE